MSAPRILRPSNRAAHMPMSVAVNVMMAISAICFVAMRLAHFLQNSFMVFIIQLLHA